MPQPVSVLLLDDGELDDVQSILESVGIPFARIRGASIVPGMQGPTDLLIATPRRIDAVAEIHSGLSEDGVPVRIVVAGEDSAALRERLRNVGFDYIVRRPVHPEALRLLVLHALYRGEERRADLRVPMGVEILFKRGLRSRRAILADLSTRGCRMWTESPLESGRSVRIEIPESLGGSIPISLKGRVVWSRCEKDLDSEQPFSAAVAFDKIPVEVRHEIEWILEGWRKGPPSLLHPAGGDDDEIPPAAPPVKSRGIRELPARNLRSDPRFENEDGTNPQTARDVAPPEAAAADATLEPALEETPTAPELGEPATAEGSAEERRKDPRAAFAARVPAFGARALRVLIGRDLSRHGMRVEASPELEMGERLHLAIYGEADEEPFLVWGNVSRADADDEFAVLFEELHDEVANRIEKLIASLPAVESLQDGEAGAMGTVVTEILADAAAPDEPAP